MEIKPFTGLRGVAAIYVMMFHYFLSQKPNNPATTFLVHGYLGVDLFFALSGFVMALNYRHMFAQTWSMSGYFRFLGRRIARVYPLYLVGTIVGFILVITGLLQGPGMKTFIWLHPPALRPLISPLIQNIFMVQQWAPNVHTGASFDPPGWSISAEWAAYLLFPLILVPTLFRSTNVALATGLIFIVILAFFGASHAPPVLRCLTEFGLGILSFRYASTDFGIAFGKNRWISPLICVVILGALALHHSDLIVILLFPLLLVSLASGNHMPARVLSSPLAELAGRLSYSLYLTHYLLMPVLNWVHGKVNAFGYNHGETWGAAVCMLLVIPISFAAYSWIEKPGRALLRDVFEGRHADASSVQDDAVLAARVVSDPRSSEA